MDEHSKKRELQKVPTRKLLAAIKQEFGSNRKPPPHPVNPRKRSDYLNHEIRICPSLTFVKYIILCRASLAVR